MSSLVVPQKRWRRGIVVAMLMMLLTVGAFAGAIAWTVGATPTLEETIDMAAWRSERGNRFARWTMERQRSEGPAEIWDHPDAPLMVVVPIGGAEIGSPANESERFAEEGPTFQIEALHPIAVGKYPVTRGEYASFVQSTGHTSGAVCYGYDGETELKKRSRFTWLNPGFLQTDEHPVVCVGWDDAKAYVDWLGRTTGHDYRLLSEAEWEYVARAGTPTARWWGASVEGMCSAANGADLTAKDRFTDWVVADCRDGYLFTSPVGMFQPNGFGLYDTLGNVWEWVEDCWNERYDAAGALNGGPRLSGDCRKRLLRGGSWHSHPRYLRSATRRPDLVENGYSAYGIRVARTLKN